MLRKIGKRNILKSVFVILFSVTLSLLAVIAAEKLFGQGPPLIWFVPSIIISSYLAGFYPGMITTLVAGLVASYNFLAPFDSFAIDSHNDQIRLLIFVTIGVFVCIVVESLHRARRRAIVLCSDLEIEIEKRKKAEQDLRRKEEEQSLILSSVPAGITYLDLDRKYRYCNETFAGWFQLPASAILGRTFSDVIGPEFAKDMSPRYDEVFNGNAVSFEDRKRHLHVDMIPDFDTEGKVRGCFVLKYDISKHLQLETHLEQAKIDAETASRAKSFFLANMSHEIRTPLSAVLGFSQLLVQADVAEANRMNWSQVIVRNGELLNTIIGDILDFSKVEAGKVEIEKSKILLSDIMSDIWTFSDLKAKEKGTNVVIKNIGAVPKYIHTDPIRLKQILLNIIGNAIKFTDKGTVEVTVHQSMLQESDNIQLVFQIKDTGCGIAEAEAKNLFNAFSQADSSVSKKYGGTGLGLMLSKTLAQRLGGDVSLTASTPGKGSVFTVSIDAGKAEHFLASRLDNVSPLARRSSTLGEPGALSGLKILVAEDCADIRLLMTQYLKALGAKVEFAENGEEALKRSESSDHDLVLMDIQMPIMDGFEVVTELRKRGSEKKIFALTAHAMKDDQAHIMATGFDDYLTKPVNCQQLIEKVKKIPSLAQKLQPAPISAPPKSKGSDRVTLLN